MKFVNLIVQLWKNILIKKKQKLKFVFPQDQKGKTELQGNKKQTWN